MNALDRLGLLAAMLDGDMGYELRRLLEADGPALRYIAAEQRADRADALATECRRQLRHRERDIDRLTERLEKAQQMLGAVASVHGGQLTLSEHVLTRGPWNVEILTDRVNHKYAVIAERR